MRDIEKLKAKHAAELAEAIACNEVAGALQLVPDSVMFGNKPTPWITHKVNDLAEAYELAQKLSWVPYVYASGTFGHVCPMDQIESRYRDGAKVLLEVEDGCPHIHVQALHRCPSSAEMVFWTKIPDGRIAKVQIVMKCAPFAPHLVYDSYAHNSTPKRKDYPEKGQDRKVIWGGSDKSASATYIWASRESLESSNIPLFRPEGRKEVSEQL